MVIRDLLKKGEIILSDKGIEDSFNESSVLFAYACDKSKTYVYTHMDDEAGDNTAELFEEYITRRADNEPVAYIVGKAWFMSLELSVNESTLIPRPETEILVEEVIAFLKDNISRHIRVLDLCTGSGCIGIAIAKYDSRVKVTLSDKNPECARIAQKNVIMHGLESNAEIIISDLYYSIPKMKFDVIAANPPYIPSSDINGLMPDVRLYEPVLALDGGTDGLDFYRKIISVAPEYLRPNGKLFLEIGIGQADDVKRMLAENDFNEISIINDIAGIPRILTATHP